MTLSEIFNTPKGDRLKARIDAANLTPEDYQHLFWQIFGACENTNRTPWDCLERIVTLYLNGITRWSK